MDRLDFIARVTAAETSLYRVAKTILRTDEDCADAVQEAILRAWEKRGSLRESQYFQTWLTRILINECYRVGKRRPDTVSLDNCGELIATNGEPVDRELRDAILRLPSKQRTAVVLYYIEGYSVAETAKLTRVPPGTVKSRLSKARHLLQEALSVEEQGGIT